MWGSNKYRVAALPVPLASGVILGSEGPQALLRNKEKFPRKLHQICKFYLAKIKHIQW